MVMVGIIYYSLEGGMYTRQYLEAQLAVALGGRLAEEIVFGAEQATTGASNDIQQVCFNITY